MAGMRFDVQGLTKGLAEMQLKMQAALSVFAETTAEIFESYAKENFPWTNRTYRASKSIRGDYQWVGSNIKVTLEIEVEHGIYLEYCNGGKYAIVWPTIQAKSADAMKGLSGILK